MIPFTLTGLGGANSSLELLTGFRFFNLDESLNVNATDIDSGSSDYRIKTDNRLYGAQIGTRYRTQFNRFRLEAAGKVGVFGNDARQTQYLGDFDNTFVFRDSSTNGTEVSFLGELSAIASYQIAKNVAIRGGYTAIWVHNVARAVAQLDYTDTPLSGTGIYDQGNAVIDGANIGIELTW